MARANRCPSKFPLISIEHPRITVDLKPTACEHECPQKQFKRSEALTFQRYNAALLWLRLALGSLCKG
ncbi:hypothetical protein I7I50_00108 [Histoplasma capsulatum G186AR]|uniref:Uncharacterized protein n=1 Tax=Ajellomyces capsulatus TaxID=5037 RepID=A0A8H7YF84_AJECA|nr:hypothetical protein I7I52_07377 [Histoplasma capsulatum]QSS72304.1 hypothetical protein I7I50_00108 [Histoplasma capsulatum G186AR]